MPRNDYDNAVHKFERKVDEKVKPGRRRKLATVTSGRLPEEQAGDVLCVDIRGNVTDSPTKAAAKQVTKDDRKTYFVKFAVDGPDRGHMLNPYSIYYKEGDDQATASRRGSMQYEFKAVTEQVFTLYCQFLTKRIGSYRLEAERLVING
jgi:hypothetical protein